MGAIVVLGALALAHEVSVSLPDLNRFQRLSKIDRINVEARFISAMASEMRAGATLRGSFISAVDDAPALDLADLQRLAIAGTGMANIARSLRHRLAFHGPALAAAIYVANETGGRAAAMLESLAQVAAEDRTLHRELRAATAQAKASSAIVGGLPLAFLSFHAVTGRLADLTSSGWGVALLTIGLALLASGALAVGVMLRAATR